MYNNKSENEILKELYRVAEENKTQPITSPDHVVLQMKELISKKTETCIFLFLDNGNHVIKKKKYHGTVDQAVVYPRDVAKVAIMCDAKSVIMAHNHPGNSLQFSDSDKKLTQRIKQGLKLFDISLLDSIIITKSGHISGNNQPFFNYV